MVIDRPTMTIVGEKEVKFKVGTTFQDPFSPKCPHKDPTKCDP